MIVTGGLARGIVLKSPKGQGTRPTPARAREALGSILRDHLDDAHVLDLFAGTGALGLESISRGAASLVMVERNQTVVETCLRPNIAAVRKALAARDYSQKDITVYTGTVASVLPKLTDTSDIVFIDPPYADDLWQSTAEDLIARGLLAAGALIVTDSPAKRTGVLHHAALALQSSRRFGDVAIEIYRFDA